MQPTTNRLTCCTCNVISPHGIRLTGPLLLARKCLYDHTQERCPSIQLFLNRSVTYCMDFNRDFVFFVVVSIVHLSYPSEIDFTAYRS